MEQPLEARFTSVRTLLEAASPRTTCGVALPSEVRRVQDVLGQATLAIRELERVAAGQPVPRSLEAYRLEIDRFNAGRPNVELLNAIRNYNHTIIDALHQIHPLRGMTVLDIGASPHGYALEHALALGAASYVGIGLDVHEPICVRGPAGLGELQNQNAEQLHFADGSFDLIVSMSTFEHVAHADRVLAEIRRVLKPGGQALVTFEPIWTCAYGHHLHHFGPVSSYMPDWAQLIWTKEQAADALASVWPADATLSLADAITWTYDSSAINRIGIREMRDYFDRSPLRVDWIVPLMDDGRDQERLAFVSETVGLTREELMTKGLTALLTRTQIPNPTPGPPGA